MQFVYLSAPSDSLELVVRYQSKSECKYFNFWRTYLMFEWQNYFILQIILYMNENVGARVSGKNTTSFRNAFPSYRAVPFCHINCTFVHSVHENVKWCLVFPSCLQSVVVMETAKVKAIKCQFFIYNIIDRNVYKSIHKRLYSWKQLICQSLSSTPTLAPFFVRAHHPFNMTECQFPQSTHKTHEQIKCSQPQPRF